MKTWQQVLAQQMKPLISPIPNDFDSSEAPTFLGCFKLPVPLTSREAVNNHMRSCKSPDKPVRQARKPSEGFLDWNTLIMPRRLII